MPDLDEVIFLVARGRVEHKHQLGHLFHESLSLVAVFDGLRELDQVLHMAAVFRHAQLLTLGVVPDLVVVLYRMDACCFVFHCWAVFVMQSDCERVGWLLDLKIWEQTTASSGLQCFCLTQRLPTWPDCRLRALRPPPDLCGLLLPERCSRSCRDGSGWWR